jgi:hypothetical protein
MKYDRPSGKSAQRHSEPVSAWIVEIPGHPEDQDGE